MLSTSSEYKTLITKTGRKFYAKITINNVEYTDIISLTYKGGTSSSDEISIGDTLSAYVDFSLANVKSVTVSGQQAKVEIGLELHEDNVEWVSLGLFTVDKAKKSGSLLNVTAYDNFYKMEKGFYSDYSGSQKITTILNEQCKKLGISFAGGADDVTYDISNLEGSTIREAVGILASYCGKNAIIDREGNLKFVWFSDINLTLTTDVYSETIEVEEEDVYINRLDCTNEEETISLGTGVGIFFSCPGMTEDRLKVLYNRIKGFNYRAMSFEWMNARPDVEAGDMLNVELDDGTVCKVPLMDITFECDGGFYGTIESKGKSETEQEYDYKSSSDKEYNFVYEQMLSVKELVAGTINAWQGNFEEITTNYINVSGKLTALEGEFSELKSTTITTDYLETNYAKIDLTNIKEGSITTAMIGTGVVGEAQIADGSITDAKIVTLTANKITAGTLDATEIEVINLKASNITVGTINGYQIADSAIDWSKLTEQVTDTIDQASADASQALEEATEANSNATVAMETADGKNTVFYQSSEPSTEDRKVNDVWFDTDDDNKMYYWNGAEWEATQFGSGAISDDSISSNKIASEVNEKILEAFNNAETALNDINNLDVGGRNFLLNSTGNLGTSEHWGNKIAVDTKTTFDNYNTLKITRTNYASGNSRCQGSQTITSTTLQAGDYITISGWIYIDSSIELGGSTNDISIRNTYNEAGDSVDFCKFNFSSVEKDTWTYFTATTQLTKTPQKLMFIVSITQNGLVWLSKLKFEKGNKATDWTPAPEDMQTSIDAVQSAITDWTYIGTTSIDGNKIYTGTVTANQIATNTITASSGIIADAAILTANIADLAVTGAKIANATIGTANIASAAITTALIADAAITNAKISNLDAAKITSGYISADRIASSTITSSMIASNAIIAGKIAANAVTTSNLQASCITAEKIATNAITTSHLNSSIITSDKIVSSAVTGDKIAASSITANHIVANTITASQIASGTITATQIASSAITADKIAAGAVTAAKISVSSLSALSANLGTVTAGTLKGTTISGASITGGTISSNTSINVTTSLYVGNYIFLGSSDTTSSKKIEFLNSSSVTYLSNIYFSTSSGLPILKLWNYYASGINTQVTLERYGLTIDTWGSSTRYSKVDLNSTSTSSCNALIQSSCSSNYRAYINVDGSTSAGIKLYVTRSGYGGAIEFFNESSGSYRAILRSAVNGNAYLGTTSYRWNTGFFTNSITASDLKEKQVINRDMKAHSLIMALQPISYYRVGKGDTGSRVHMGFGAQTVAKTVKELGYSDLSLVQATIVDGEEEKPYYGEEIDDSKLSWGLNYIELIPPIVSVVQSHDEEISKLKSEISQLQAKLNAYENSSMEVKVYG